MAAAQAKGDVAFTGAVDMSDATVTFPTAITAADNMTWTGDHAFEGAVDLSAATMTFAAGEIDSADIASGSIDPVHLSSTAISPAANAACAILATTTEINLTVTDATNTAISTSAAEPGQVIYIRAAAVSGGGSYTLAVTGGTLTFNSTGEAAIVRRNTADDAWVVFSLCPSSSTAANIATIV